ncbi:MAG: lysine--tRNA ligase [Candidatus Roizmanbacteria bacterium]|nr:MAG: lysine--tRNA ligase [Candidatus Roizmanbacteria bacterium]
MIWVDREVKKLKERNLTLEHVDDMKTPSGRIHVGALRGVVIHDLVYKVLLENNVKSSFTYVFQDFDPMDAIPSYLDYDKWEKYAGMRMCDVPSPVEGFKNFAQYYASEFKQVFESINCHPEIIWESDLILAGKMNEVIKEALNNADKIREIYKRISKAEKPADWYPFQVVCENCRKIGTTQVYKWDGEFVYYKCLPQMVAWAKGCEHEGKISPFNGNGKLHWKVDWPALWKVTGITIEGAGKDHMSSGGSFDVAKALCEEVFNYPPVYPLPYEWFIIGGKKMSSSKGVGTSAFEVSQILPADVLRFLIVRTPIGTAVDFNPNGDTIPNLFDDYDRCLNAYFDKLEEKIPDGKPGEVLEDFARIIELSQVKPLPKKRLFIPRFRTVVNLIKTQVDIPDFFEKQKGSPLTSEEKEMVDERITYAQIYLKDYALAEEKIEFIEKIPEDFTPTENQKKFMQNLTDNLENRKPETRDDIQQVVFETLKQNNFQPKEVFSVFYKLLIGRDAGPKAADLILNFGLDKVIKRLREAENKKSDDSRTSKNKSLFSNLIDKKIFSINPNFAEKFPSVIIGIAIIKNVNISKNNPELEKEIKKFIDSQSSLTNDIISSYPEIQSYRRIYKETGIDWHSRRPSPEALLRRIAQKKGLYQINTCVDAYNLVVMKNRVSSGAFDLDKIIFPTELRFAKTGEEILLLGDKEPTQYKKGEAAYFDQQGGYNIDFNYRDAQRTAVTENTKNLLVNIDGVYGIDRSYVEKNLKETIEIIQKYCGGKVEMAGIVTAI